MGGLIERKLIQVQKELKSMSNSLKQRANLNETITHEEVKAMAEHVENLEGEIESIFAAARRAHEILKKELKLI